MSDFYGKRKGGSLSIYICVLSMILFFSHGQSAEADTTNQGDQIVIGFNKYPPYHYMKGKKEPNGIAVEIANNIASILKINLKYRELPWSRCLNYAKNGKIDAILFIFKKPEREKYLFYYDDNLIAHEVNAIYTLKGNEIKYSGKIENDLKPYKIGVIRDFSYGPAFDSVADKLRRDMANDVELLIKKLLKKRNDAILHNTLVINWYSKSMGVINEITQISPPISVDPGYIAFSKAAGKGELAKSFADAMQKFKQTEEYKILLEKSGAIK